MCYSVLIPKPLFFPSNWLELSPSLEYNSRDLSISPVLKLLYWTSFSEVFALYSSVFSFKNTNNLMFQANNQTPGLKFRSGDVLISCLISQVYMAEMDKVHWL